MNRLNVSVSKGLKAFAGMALLVTPFALGQDDESEDEIFEMSPFVVDGTTDGYAARSSLAGSRINADLKDLPNSISVMTEEFLTDIAATTVEDAMLYSVNVENFSEYTDVSNPNGLGILFNDFTGRVRGLASGGRTRDFFDTNVQQDVYNLDRVTINSGANAVLYGLGGVAGIVNRSYKKANLSGDKHEVGVSLDNNGLMRLTANLNKVLVDEKFALRATMLEENGELEQDFSDRAQTRLFLASTYRPFEKTTIRAYYEDIDMSMLLPRNTAPYDGGALAYLDHIAAGGSPYFDNSIENAGQPIPAEWESIVEVDTQANTAPVFVLDRNSIRNIGPLGEDREEGDPYTIYSVRTIDPSTLATVGTDRVFRYSLPQKYGLTYPEQNIYGTSQGRNMFGEVWGISLQQSILENLDLEIGYNEESAKTEFYGGGWGAGELVVRADPNMYLPDGVTPNPYKGMLYTQGTGQDTIDVNNYEQFRLALNYRIDFTENLPWLGRHDITALYEDKRYHRWWLTHKKKIVPAGADSPVFGYNAPQNESHLRFYFDPISGEGMAMPFDSNEGGQLESGEFVYSNRNSLARGSSWNQIQRSEASMAAMQSSFWDGRLTTTVGVRDSKFTNGRNDDGFLYRAGDGFVWGTPNYDEIDVTAESFSAPTEPDLVRTYGGVFDINDFVSVYYNFADTFEQPASNVTFEGPIGAASGETEDIGIALNTKDGTSGLRLTFYEAAAVNNLSCGNCPTIRNQIYRLEERIHTTRLNNSYYQRKTVLNHAAFNDGEPEFDFGGWDESQPFGTYFMSNDTEGEGYELEAFANVNNFTIRLTLANNEAKGTNQLKGWDNYIDERYSYWKAWAEFEQKKIDEGNSTFDNPGTVSNRFRNAAGSIVSLRNQNGAFVDQSTGIRSNGTVRYNFIEGKFKGWHVGSHVRFREAGVIGYESGEVDNPFSDFPGLGATIFSPDLDAPVYGDDQLLFDFFAGLNGKLNDSIRYSVNLNIRNLFDESDTIPQRVDHMGDVRVYTFQTPRRITLSTKFTF